MDQPSADAVAMVLRPRTRDLGDMHVRRVLPDAKRRTVGPFIFFDHMGPVDFPAGLGMNVPPHPHIGIATVTYLFAGEILHRDSLGIEKAITRGAVDWMTAGRGIVHSERTPPDLLATGSHLHGIQAWVALPREHEEIEPAFDHYPASDIPSERRPGVEIRVVVGSAFGLVSPVKTLGPTLYAEIDLASGTSLEIPADPAERAVYVVKGQIRIGERSLPEGSMAVLTDAVAATAEAVAGTKIMLLGGEPVDGDREIWWNFVSSRPERIEQAKADWREDRFDKVPGDLEFTPLPES